MQLDKRLNLVIPITQGDKVLYAHSQPISLEAFKTHWRLLSLTYAQIFAGGLGTVAAPRVAAMLIKEIAEQQKLERQHAELMAEINRLTVIIASGVPILLPDAIRQNVIDEQDRDELENALVFFTVVSAMEKRAEANTVMRGACLMWGGQMTSSSFTEYAASLPTSTETANSGASPAPSPDQPQPKPAVGSRVPS